MRLLAILLVFGGCFSKPDPPGGASGDGGVDAPPGINRIFVSSELVMPASLGGVDKADERCARLAMTAGYEGTYIAYLSTSTQSAQQRIAARGSPSGWVRPDGKPVANSLDDLVRGNHFYPVRVTEKMVDLFDSQTAIATATLGTGDADAQNTCNDYTANGLILYGQGDAEGRPWTEDAQSDCSSSYHLYCVGISFASTVSVTPVQNARTVFVSHKIDPAVGRANLDAACASDATLNSLTGTYVAGIASTTDSIETFVPTDRALVRRDGVVVFEPNFTKMQAPVALDAGRQFVDGGIATGARAINAPASAGESCLNWTSHAMTDQTSIGWSMRSIPDEMFSNRVGGCDEPDLRVYCFQSSP